MSHDNHNEIMRILGRLEEGVIGVNKRLDKVNGRLDKHSDSIDGLETFRDQLKGKVAIVSAFVGVVGSIVANFIWTKLKGE